MDDVKHDVWTEENLQSCTTDMDEYIPKPKSLSSLLRHSHQPNTNSSHHHLSEANKRVPEEEESTLLSDPEGFSSSQNDVQSSFEEIYFGNILTSVSNNADFSILKESDISSSSLVKETETVAFSSTLLENEVGPSSSVEVQTEDLPSILIKSEPLPISRIEIEAVLLPSCEKEAVILSSITENEEVLSSATSRLEDEHFSAIPSEDEALPTILSENELALSWSHVNAEDLAPSPIPSSSIMADKVNAPNQELVSEAIPSSSDDEELGYFAYSSTLTEKKSDSSSSILLHTEEMIVISTETELVSPSSSVEEEEAPFVQEAVSSIEKAKEAPPLTGSVSSSSSPRKLTDVTIFFKPIISGEYSRETEAKNLQQSLLSDVEPVKSSEVKVDKYLFHTVGNLNNIPDAETLSLSDDIVSPDFSINSEMTIIDSHIIETDNHINSPIISYPEDFTKAETPAPPELKPVLTLDLAPSNIDEEFEKLIQNMSPPNDIDKTFSAVSLDLETILDERNYPTEINVVPLDQSKAEDSNDGRLPSQVEEASFDRTTLTEEVAPIVISDIKTFSGIDARRKGPDYPSLLRAKSSLKTNLEREDINDHSVQPTSSTDLEPVKIIFDVLNSQAEERNTEKTNESVVELQSESLNERETNFDREIQSLLIKDNTTAEVISDCASDSSSMSVSPNPDISLFRSETNSASTVLKETPKNNDEDLKRMDDFDFDEPLIIVTARKVRTYVDDAEQFQNRLERKKRRLRIYPEDFSKDVQETKPALTDIARPLKESENSRRLEPCQRETHTCKPLKPEALRPFSGEEPRTPSLCSDALPGHLFRSLERREERRLTTYDHSSEFPLNMRVPHRRAFWDNRITDPKSESPKRQPSIKVTGIVKKCKETFQTLSGPSESLSTVVIDEEELPRNHRKKFQEAKCFFQNLEQGKAPAAVPPDPEKPEALEKPEVLEKPISNPATVEERFKVTGIYRDVLGDGAAKTAAGAPLRGVPRRKAVVAALDSFRK